MISVPERKKNLEDSTQEIRKRFRLSKDRPKEVIRCDFCGSLAVNAARREDGKIAYCCENCSKSIKECISKGPRLKLITRRKTIIETPAWISIGPIVRV